jgi:ABC-type transporter Mla maintaining outer membrane lipid asymmetry ATPase subunit MlaF
MSDTPKIAVRDLRKSFGRKRVLDGVNLDVGVAESVVVIGGSGTGKSVLLKCILGLLQPDSGSIKIDGEEIGARRSPARSACCSRVLPSSIPRGCGRMSPSA